MRLLLGFQGHPQIFKLVVYAVKREELLRQSLEQNPEDLVKAFVALVRLPAPHGKLFTHRRAAPNPDLITPITEVVDHTDFFNLNSRCEAPGEADESCRMVRLQIEKRY